MSRVNQTYIGKYVHCLVRSVKYTHQATEVHLWKCHPLQTPCCIRTNIGEELNLTNWQITIQSPNTNLANIFKYHITRDTFGFDIGLTSHSFHNKYLIFITQYLLN